MKHHAGSGPGRKYFTWYNGEFFWCGDTNAPLLFNTKRKALGEKERYKIPNEYILYRIDLQYVSSEPVRWDGEY